MRFRYSTTDPSQDEFDSLPRVTLTLQYENQRVDVVGLADSGSTVNVLPYQVGLQLGATWDDSQAYIRLAGSLGDHPAMPLVVTAEIDGVGSARLAFAWVKNTDAPLILGQTNFFMEFDVCFYRSKLEFEINTRPPE